MYIKVKNNQIASDPLELPSFYRYKDGRVCAQWNLLVQERPEEAKAEGYYPLEYNYPECDLSYQFYQFSSYEFLEDKVIANYTVQDKPIAPLKAKRNSEINELRDAKIASGFTWNGVVFDSDQKSLLNITGTAASILMDQSFPENFTWRAANNTDVPMTGEQVKEFAIAARNHTYAQHLVARYHKDTITALETAQEVVDYDITAGW